MVSNKHKPPPKKKTKQSEQLKGLQEKYYKAQKRSLPVALQIISSEIPENCQKKIYSTWNLRRNKM